LDYRISSNSAASNISPVLLTLIKTPAALASIVKANIILFFWIMSVSVVYAQTYTVKDIPNTKLINNSYVSNPDTILSASTVRQIDEILSSLEKRTTAQVAVVAVNSIGSADIFEFAQQLFVEWGIGKDKKDNGLLILLVVDQRTVRFHTGYGLEGVLTDLLCKHIQMEKMVPQFKNGDYNAGVIAGVQEVANVLSDPAYADELRDESKKMTNGWYLFFTLALIVGGLTFLIWLLVLHLNGSFSDSKKKKKTNNLYPEMRLSRWEWIIAFGVIPFGLLIVFNYMTIDTDNHILIFLAVIYCYFIFTMLFKRLRMKKVVDQLKERKDYYGIVQFFNEYQGFWLFSAIVFPLPMLLFFFLYLSRKKFFRNHPRDCKSCNKPLAKLNEFDDDQYLQKGQIVEEGLRSVDYDVWLCSNCKSIETWNYVNRFSKYSPCPKCKTRAYFNESDRTIESPTYDSTGTGQTTKRCKFCNQVDVSTYTIAQLTRSSSSGGSGGSSSSGGGSWGGGSSGGGGASSSW
jgi:uncharacterized protein